MRRECGRKGDFVKGKLVNGANQTGSFLHHQAGVKAAEAPAIAREEAPVEKGEAMSRSKQVVVTGEKGLRGTVDHASQPQGCDASQVQVTLESGERILVPRDVLIPQSDGTYYLPLAAEDIGRVGNQIGEEGGTITVPVIVEELEVGKRVVETGKVRVTKQVREREEVVDLPLLREEVDVRRVAVDLPVNGPLPVRFEGDVMIIPVIEEVLVVEKRFVLKEEIHIIKRRVEERDPQRVVLRSEEATVERINTGEQVVSYGESNE